MYTHGVVIGDGLELTFMNKKTPIVIIFAIFFCLLLLMPFAFRNSGGQIVPFGTPFQWYLRDKYGLFFFGILETENKLEFYSPLTVWTLRRNEVQPVFNTYRITNLSDEIFPSSAREDSVLFISESILSALKEPTIVGNFQNQTYYIYILDEEVKLTNISKTMRRYSNSSYGIEIRPTTIYEINGLCYLDETFQLPQKFNSLELLKTGIFFDYFENFERLGAFIQTIEEVSHDIFEYAYIFSYDISSIDEADFYGFIGFKSLEIKIPYYPWAVYSSFDDILLSRKFYNYQYFLIFPRYRAIRGDENISLSYIVDRQIIKEMINSIVEDILE